MIRQLTPSRQPILDDMADLMRFAFDHIRFESAEPEVRQPPADGIELQVVRTIAEVAVPIPDPDNPAEIDSALDVAIDHVRLVQTTLSIATQGGMRLVERATLPPMVPTFLGEVHTPDEAATLGRPFSVHESIAFVVSGCAPPAALSISPKPLDSHTMERLEFARERVSSGEPFHVFSDLRREALTQREFDGNRRMALIALAAAGEVLLDTMLLHLLWEEHTPPESAAGHLDRSIGHALRVARHIPPRLGGSWASRGSSPPGSYFRDLVDLRHRAVHAGYDPSESEFEAAWKAFFDLERYLGDRLAAPDNLNRYTRTAWHWMGKALLEQRKAFTAHVRALTEDPSEPHWPSAFTRWRHHVEREILSDAPPPGERSDRLVGCAEHTSDGDWTWSIHDPLTCHAALIDNPTRIASKAQIDFVLASAPQDAAEGEEPWRIALAYHGGPLPKTAQWRPDHEIYADLRIYPGTRTTPPPSGA